MGLMNVIVPDFRLLACYSPIRFSHFCIAFYSIFITKSENDAELISSVASSRDE